MKNIDSHSTEYFVVAYGTNYPDEESAPRGPKFYLYPTDIEILGSTSEVYLECAATGLTQPTYQWTVTREDGQTRPIVGPRYIVTNGRVTISNPQVALDGGSYQCSAKNEFGVVLTPPVVLSFAGIYWWVPPLSLSVCLSLSLLSIHSISKNWMLQLKKDVCAFTASL